ncbi:hypothetical protein BOTBODRAFT_107461 [Botryobasidium botryosum FD-172 SS1]|uniref:Large ribosomal subunit protein bL35c n=1 Tax=Botryobasidium botryosum (strain FD-172 SS1) TaxID=930990 RepID=A0A067MJV8_BOTB1|nr:hypothetical protein BOTBODRAFT_107461 [Botryobasidium botryosum FD-172 SS1]
MLPSISGLRSSLSIRSLLLPFPSPRAFTTSLPTYFPKLKTHSGAKKRWSSLPSGLFKRGKAGRRHLNSGMPSSRLNRLGNTAYANPQQAAVLRKLMPYG